jgi:archaellum component FlaD/FlaE/archaellum component FlaC
MGLFGGSDEEEEESADEELDEASDPLLDDGGDDLLDGGDDMAFGDMDKEDGGGGGAGNAELENRMDELENEVGSLSSTVNTVKSENEQISESVDDIEENIRKLLEVYEMVTRGVNPFVNEDELGDAFDGGGGAAGGGASLFGGDEGDQDEEALDDDVAGADAEDFFDEDLGEEEFDDDMDAFDDGDDLDEAGDEFGGDMDDFDDGMDDFDDGADDLDDGGDTGGDEGKSFEELKAEYDAGDADWQGEEGDAGETLDAPDSGPAEMGGDGMPGEIGGSESDAEAFDTDGLDEVAADDAGAPATDTVESDASAGRRPHLDALPDGYASDVVVMEWLEFLVDQGGVDGAARTIAYYESIDWLGETAAEDLQTYLGGFGEATAEDLPDPETVEARSPLSVQCHRTSLRYVSRLSSASMGMDVMDRLDEGDGASAPAPDASSPGPEWLAGNGHDAAAPAAEAAGGPATDGGTDPGDGRAPTWQHPPGSGAVGSGHDPAPEERPTRARGTDDGPPPGGRRGVERAGAEAPTPESTDDHTDQ